MDMSIALGVGLGIGLAVLGAGIGQGMTANGAVSGIARQPEAAGKIQTAMIIGLALIESLVILTFVVVNGMAGKVPAPAAAPGGGEASLVRPMEKGVAQNMTNNTNTYQVPNK
jgi:F-type H+-transporting ATPase subunit c